MGKVVIIGGGVIGLSAAWELHRRGADVLVLDARTAGTGASAANAGYIVSTYAGPVPTPGLIQQSLKWMLDSSSPLYIRPRMSPSFISWLYRFWRACNSTAYAAGLEATDRLRTGSQDILEQWRADGIAFEEHHDGRLFAYSNQTHMESSLNEFQAGPYSVPTPMFGDDLHHFEPVLSDAIVAGFHIESDWTIQPNSLIAGLIANLTSVGVEVRSGAPVVDLDISNGRVVAVRTPSERIEADHVLIAAGAWTGQIGKLAGVKLPIESGKGYGLDFKPAPVKPQRPISLKDAQIAVSPFDDGLRLGGTMELSGVNDTMSWNRINAIENGGKKFLKDFPKDAKPTQVWAGMRPMAPDGLPVLGHVSGFSNLTVASGHSMLGVTLAPATSVLMADLITTGKTPDVLKPFSPNRFRGLI